MKTIKIITLLIIISIQISCSNDADLECLQLKENIESSKVGVKTINIPHLASSHQYTILRTDKKIQITGYLVEVPDFDTTPNRVYFNGILKSKKIVISNTSNWDISLFVEDNGVNYYSNTGDLFFNNGFVKYIVIKQGYKAIFKKTKKGYLVTFKEI